MLSPGAGRHLAGLEVKAVTLAYSRQPGTATWCCLSAEPKESSCFLSVPFATADGWEGDGNMRVRKYWGRQRARSQESAGITLVVEDGV